MNKMRGVEIMRRLEALSEEDRKYVLQFFIGGVDMIESGFTMPHADQTHAAWALDALDEAIKQKEPK